MKENFKLGRTLLIITAIAGVLLGFANNLTKDAILENAKMNKEDLKAVLSQAESVQDIEFTKTEAVKEVYKAVNGNEVVGHVLKVTSKGFHGPVDFLIGISTDNKVSGIRVLSHAETPGLGSKIAEVKFTSRFTAKPIAEDLEVVKVTPNKDNEVEAISGATTSSKATVTAVNDAIRFYKENIKGEEVESKKETDADTAATGS
ncbi:RnfABCDGE type electron transport complex subunit G [Clostridium gasigenes]|uniref:Ion-translocating oxidoreductase complex subunit G n=1 Tax=Clostridium gasigenes TaxID=94869 RepID=A0A1H0RH43_9CLOT|nr:RnfABCDGE type electron transport complex subunit G [Clostridium gasigenes]MBB6715212.1 RnfABCDGE type electron transport complex subunit G [Clostridium gasigenes]MBU3104163.1 RnfABCDGE type electron transport complex subunit G [Clostridium gasigenes]MBU3135553.1 RnfABCDGE type electron transport complex subunit G [Clostridium gasigenes]NKF05922.1 RnfABCDGE type electron transport complex subunit G [Clostridium gasigenes]QSW19351.1 RnfABCDGE type electron transport complex subunit G [Clostr